MLLLLLDIICCKEIKLNSLHLSVHYYIIKIQKNKYFSVHYKSVGCLTYGKGYNWGLKKKKKKQNVCLSHINLLKFILNAEFEIGLNSKYTI